MPKFPRISGDELVAALLRIGFTVGRQRGSHVRLYGPDGLRVNVATGRSDLPIGTIAAVLRQTSLSVDDLIKALQ